MRLKNWPERLAAFLQESYGRPFEWGQHDCLMFAAGAVEAVTGVRPYAAYMGQYESAEGALKLLMKERQTNDLLTALSDDLGEPTEGGLCARRGDIVAMLVGGKEEGAMPYALGVCDGGNALFIDIDKGLQAHPLADCVCAWRVG